MPIPKFNGNGLLPPHNGELTDPASISPYLATTLELCQRFAGTPERRAILKGLLALRSSLGRLGFVSGFQWVSGDFLEDDRQHPKPPKHVQVVTFCHPPESDDGHDAGLVAAIRSRKKTLQQFRVDHIPVYLTFAPELLVRYTHHWSERMSHQRETETRKGFVQIALNTTSEDNAALSHLESLEGQV